MRSRTTHRDCSGLGRARPDSPCPSIQFTRQASDRGSSVRGARPGDLASDAHQVSAIAHRRRVLLIRAATGGDRPASHPAHRIAAIGRPCGPGQRMIRPSMHARRRVAGRARRGADARRSPPDEPGERRAFSLSPRAQRRIHRSPGHGTPPPILRRSPIRVPRSSAATSRPRALDASPFRLIPGMRTGLDCYRRAIHHSYHAYFGSLSRTKRRFPFISMHISDGYRALISPCLRVPFIFRHAIVHAQDRHRVPCQRVTDDDLVRWLAMRVRSRANDMNEGMVRDSVPIPGARW